MYVRGSGKLDLRQRGIRRLAIEGSNQLRNDPGVLLRNLRRAPVRVAQEHFHADEHVGEISQGGQSPT